MDIYFFLDAANNIWRNMPNWIIYDEICRIRAWIYDEIRRIGRKNGEIEKKNWSFSTELGISQKYPIIWLTDSTKSCLLKLFEF